MRSYLVSAVIVLVVLAIVYRVEAIRKVVTGA